MSDIVEDINCQNEEQERKRASLLPLILFILAIVYLYSILFGDYSIKVYLNVKNEKEKIVQEYNALQKENQKLQKKHFELIQLTPSEDAF